MLKKSHELELHISCILLLCGFLYHDTKLPKCYQYSDSHVRTYEESVLENCIMVVNRKFFKLRKLNEWYSER